MATATREAYGRMLGKLVSEHDDIVVLDADLSKSTKSYEAAKVNPNIHFNMGIAEGNMMSVAAGLAASGKVVYASSFAMFATGRAFEQIRNSICYPRLNVKVCASHAGISVGEDGATHQCIEDLAIMRAIPNMKVFQPCDAREAEAIIKAVYEIDGPCYVRLGRLAVEDVYTDENFHFEYGKGVVLHQGSKVALVATGLMVQHTLKAREILAEQGIDATVVNIHTIKPIDKDLIEELAKTHEYIITIEEHTIVGGFGSAVAEVLSPLGLPCKHFMIGMNDCFGRSGTPKALFDYFELDGDHLARRIQEIVK